MDENKYLLWFSRVVWAGIAANCLLAGFALVAPVTVTELVGLPMAEPLVWPRFASFLLLLLSGFYVPAARDPLGNHYNSVWTVACRVGGVVFFSIVGGNYIAFALFDLTFGLPEGILLWLGYSTASKQK
jgi:hypothetical protein